MKSESIKQSYLAPEVEVLGLQTVNVLCGSNTERLDGDTEPGWSWE